ncbi:MAG TPA: lytic transglycosylase domain-containing protein [Steroidobacteraceae bacterium]|nr:lytic transglycosylase domain-containing protein [Steroidobacteraceae bacterium]
MSRSGARTFSTTCASVCSASVTSLLLALALAGATAQTALAAPFATGPITTAPISSAAVGSAPARLPQQDPQLRAVVQQAIDQAQCFPDRFDSAVWYRLMEPKLRLFVKDDTERLQILQTVYCETHRPGLVALPPGLVMAMLEVESRFDPWAVSRAGAVGLMQVMPFWPEQLGMRRYELTRVVPNIHMGCAILRYYLSGDHRDIRRALARYNGSVGRRDYPDRVVRRWTTYWNGADDLGREPDLKSAASPPLSAHFSP